MEDYNNLMERVHDELFALKGTDFPVVFLTEKYGVFNGEVGDLAALLALTITRYKGLAEVIRRGLWMAENMPEELRGKIHALDCNEVVEVHEA